VGRVLVFSQGSHRYRYLFEMGIKTLAFCENTGKPPAWALLPG
jgi:hypothetical protein